MTRTVREAIEGHHRVIVFHDKKRGWAVTTFEGDDFERQDWRKTLADALGCDVRAAPEERVAISRALRKAHYTPWKTASYVSRYYRRNGKKHLRTIQRPGEKSRITVFEWATEKAWGKRPAWGRRPKHGWLRGRIDW